MVSINPDRLMSGTICLLEQYISGAIPLNGSELSIKGCDSVTVVLPVYKWKLEPVKLNTHDLSQLEAIRSNKNGLIPSGTIKHK